MHELLLISLGGMLGANVRYVLSNWAAARYGTGFPYGTLLVNAGGSFLIGLVLGLLTASQRDNPDARLFIVTGFLGAETTFSTFAYETVALLRFGNRQAAIRNLLANLSLGLVATAVGLGSAAAIVAAGLW
jgi:CrcB protein